MCEELYALFVDSFKSSINIRDVWLTAPSSSLVVMIINVPLKTTVYVCMWISTFLWTGEGHHVLNYRHNLCVVLFKCIWYGDKDDAKNRVHDYKICGTASAYVAKE